MDALNVLLNAAVVTAVALVLGYLGRERFDMLQRQIDDLRDETRRAASRVDDRLLRVENGLDAVRSDLTQVALAVGAGRKPNAG